MTPFAALMAYPQFIIQRLVGDGKTKIPINYKTGQAVNPNDPNQWITGEQAVSICASSTYVAAFVLTANDPFWCLDIDNCVVDGEWSDLAKGFMSAFAGCGIEVGHSGTSLHIYGTGALPEHRCRDIHKLHLELYHELKPMNIGSGQVGDAAFDASHLLPALVSNYFPPIEHATGAQWTTTHDPLSLPLLDDAELIRKARSVSSAGAKFGNKLTFKQLYNGDENAIADTFPPENDTDPFNRSNADAALCQHLAFWTGKNCERMQKLFESSALVREKWFKRKKYREDTILRAVGVCRNMYGEERAQKLATATRVVPTEGATPAAGGVTSEASPIKLGLKIVEFTTIPEFFKGHYYLTKQGRMFCPDGEIRNQTDYTSMYSNWQFLKLEGGKPYADAWKAYVINPEVNRLEAFNTGYFPQYAFGELRAHGGRSLVNEYINLDGKRMKGDPTPFLNHVQNLLPRGDDGLILLSWIAALIQYPGKKFLWSPFIQGIQGNGKSMFVRVIEYCIGDEHVHDIDPEDFCQSGGKFNFFITNNRVGVLQEIAVGDRKQADSALKRIIDVGRMGMQKKGGDQTTVTTCINIFISSNFKDSLPITDSSRRYAPLFCEQQDQASMQRYNMHRTGTYFRDFNHWLQKCDGYGIIADYLDCFVIPEKYNPMFVDKAPMTTALAEAIEESRVPIHQSVVDALESGEPGTLGGWASTTVVRKILIETAGYRTITSKTVTTYLKLEGYVTHPALKNRGRATKTIMSEGSRPTLFVKAGSIPYHLQDSTEVMDAYIKAQGYQTAQQIGVTV